MTSSATSASRKLDSLSQGRWHFKSEQYILYRSQVCLILEHCSHIWEDAPKLTQTSWSRGAKKSSSLINNPTLTDPLQSFSHRLAVGALSIFYRYCLGHCSEELPAMIPPAARSLFITQLQLYNSSTVWNCPSDKHTALQTLTPPPCIHYTN